MGKQPFRGRQGRYPRQYNNNNNNNNGNKPRGIIPKSLSEIPSFVIQSSNGTTFPEVCDVFGSFIGGQASLMQSARAARLIRTLQDKKPLPPIAPVRVTAETFVSIKDENGSPTKFDKDMADLEYETAADNYKADMKDERKRDIEWKETKSKVFESTRGLCSEPVMAAVMSSLDWIQIEESYDLLGFLILIRDVCNDTDATDMIVLVEKDMKLLSLLQGNNEALTSFYNRFTNMITEVEDLGGCPGYHERLQALLFPAAHFELYPSIEDEDLTSEQRQEVYDLALHNSVQQYRALLFLKLADHRRFGSALADLKNHNLISKKSQYPPDLPAALRLLTKYETEQPHYLRRPPPRDTAGGESLNQEGVAFFAGGVKCFFCLGPHPVKECSRCTSAIVKDIYLHRGAGTFTWPKPGQTWKSPAPPTGVGGARPTGVGGGAQSTGVGGGGQPTGVGGIVNTNVTDEGSVATALTAGSVEARIAAYNANHAGSEIPSYGDLVGALGYTFMSLNEPLNGVCCLAAGRSDALPWYKAYLDSCASFHSSIDTSFLTNVHQAESVLHGSCNAGSTSSTCQGTLMNRFHMWINKNGIANLLSIPVLEATGYKVKYESGTDWIVTTPEGEEIVFKTEKTGVTAGMPYIDIRDYIGGVAMLQTVRDNMKNYTPQEIKDAIIAREAQAKLGHPSDATMRKLVSSNSILNCPVTTQALTNSTSIFGPNLGGVRGDTVRVRPGRVDVVPHVVPNDFGRLHKFVVLVADVMFVNGVAFFVTRSTKLKLITAECVPTRTALELSKSLNKIVNVYARSGFIVKVACMDTEFDKIKDKMETVTINTAAPREHVPEIERAIRDIKNRCRAVLSTLPYDYYHRQIIIHLVYFVVRMINAVPSKVGVSSSLSPSEIVFGRKLDFNIDCPISFGSYVEGSPDPDITNTMDARTVPCIALGTTGNIQGSQRVFDLNSGKVLVRRTVRELPFPERVLKRVNEWGLIHGSAYGRKLVVLDRKRLPISPLADNEVGQSPLTSNKVHPDILCEFPGITTEADYEGKDGAIQDTPPLTLRDRVELLRASLQSNNNSRHNNIFPSSSPTTSHMPPIDESEDEDEEPPPMARDDDSDDDSDDDDDDSDGVVDNINNDVSDEDDDDDEQCALEDIVSGTRQRDPPNNYTPSFNNKTYEDAHPTLFTYQGQTFRPENGILNLNLDVDDGEQQPTPMTEEEIETHIIGVAMIDQYSLKKASKLFGEDASNKAVSKELNQIHNMDTYIPMDARQLTKEQRQKALNALLFLTQKRDGSIKARKCADGSKQRFEHGYEKINGAAPTVDTNSVMITVAIAAKERRDVTTIDLPGAYLHTDNDEETIMLLKGKLAELLVQVEPSLYRKYVITSSTGEPMLYVKLHKALYGLLRSALLFYRKLSKQLVDYGFTINKYDPCVATKNIPTSASTGLIARANNLRYGKDKSNSTFVVEDSYQQTVVWHVDDLMLTHIDPMENNKFVLHFGNLYNKEALKPITVHRGDIHDYLGVDYSFDKKTGEATVSQIKYVHKILDDFPQLISGPQASPAANHLFEIRPDDDNNKKLLSETEASQFHHAVAQLLFLCMRSRRDIQTPVSFLTTRVRVPDQDDWGKLVRVLRYLDGTKHMKLRLSVDTMSIVRWWVDASYGTHHDGKGHTGMMMTLGKGATMSSSKKQKMNTKSSTESELVGVDDCISKILWTKYFIEDLGYKVEHNILFQDNKSTILLATNGRMSSSSKTKHIKARYFFVKDKIEQGDLEVQYEPTKKMRGDMNTKPLQGQSFCDQRADLMNIDSNYDDEKERLLTHPDLLPTIDLVQVNNNNIKTIASSLRSNITTNKTNNNKTSLIGASKPLNQRRSVLGQSHLNYKTALLG